MNKILMISFILSSLSLISSVLATTDVVGGTNDQSGFSANQEYASMVIASGSGAIQSVGMHWSGVSSGNAVMGLYSDNSNTPYQLLASSSVGSISADWINFTLTGINIVQNTKYWIVVSTQNSGANARPYDLYPASSTHESRYTAHTYDGTLLSSWGTDHTWVDGSTFVWINAQLTYNPNSFLNITLSSPTNISYNSNPNITFTPSGDTSSTWSCLWNLNGFLYKSPNVTVNNNTAYSDYPSGVLNGINGTNVIKIDCSGSSKTNTTNVTYTILGTGTSTTSILNYGVRISWMNDKTWIVKTR